jgi:arylsulfatase A-like enzyme
MRCELNMMKLTCKFKPGVNIWRQNGLLLYLVIYSCFIVLIHVGGLAGLIVLPEGREDLVIETALASPLLLLQIGAYVLAVIALNFLPLVFLLFSMRVATNRIRSLGVSNLSYFLIAVLCLWTAILAFNKLYFPRSSFALLLPLEESTSLSLIGGTSLAIFFVIGVLPTLWRMATYLLAPLKRAPVRIAIGSVLAIGLIAPLYSFWDPQPHSAQKPDIIIIGMDSFSPLHMEQNPGALPEIEKMLQESTVFTQTLTPLARTFPAWTSILSAKYPVNSGARFNLTPFEQVETRTTLPMILKGQGYATIYAQDERKFNNIDESFGFDATVGPKPGAAEFVLTKVADHPLANLTLLTPWAQRLFPFVALNRAAPIHYDPDEFIAAIVKQLPQDRSKPLFLAAHFCLAHHPYTWRTQGRWTDDGVALSTEEKHIYALGKLEQQIYSLIQALKASGRLDNAILVLLSDHGESLGYEDGLWVSGEKHINPHEAFKEGRYTAFPIDSGFSGHGTNVLDRTQYHSLLAFRGYGEQKNKFPADTRNGIASLVDVMPTLMNALKIDLPAKIDGIDLLAKGGTYGNRVIPTETGIRFSALDSIVNIDEGKLLEESKAYYQIDPASARLVVKPEQYDKLVASKDIALHTEEWMLALLRKDASPTYPRVALLVNKLSGGWTMGNDKKLIGEAPMEKLRQAAGDLYGSEIDDFKQTWVFN